MRELSMACGYGKFLLIGQMKGLLARFYHPDTGNWILDIGD
jgi:hypothetical protein